MADPITFITAVDITPARDAAWHTVDVSANIPTTASGVLLRSHYASSTSSDDIGFRKTGSTDDYSTAHAVAPYFAYTAIGVDGSQQLDIMVNSGGAGKEGFVELIGYFDQDSVSFFTNAITHAPASTGVYSAWDISSDTGADTAIAAILYLGTTRSNDTDVAWRKNGSTEDHYQAHGSSTGGTYLGTAIVPVDANEILEVKWASAFYNDFKIVGYITANFTGIDPPTDESITTLTTWTDITTSGALAVAIESIATTPDHVVGFRKNGDTTDRSAAPEPGGERSVAIIEADASGIIEGYTDSLDAGFFVRGYFTAEAGSAGRIMGSLASQGGLAGPGGIAGPKGGLAG